MGDNLFDNLFGSPKRRRKAPKKRPLKRKVTKKRVQKKPKSKITKRKIGAVRAIKVSASDNNDFKKIVKILSSFEPKNIFSNHTIKNMSEKSMEDKLYTGLSFLMVQNKLKTQVKKGKGIVDMAYRKIGIELKLNRRGVDNMLPRLVWQAKNYHKKYKKLLIYVVNHQKISGEANAYVKNHIQNGLDDSKSIRKRDIKIIVKKV